MTELHSAKKMSLIDGRVLPLMDRRERSGRETEAAGVVEWMEDGAHSQPVRKLFLLLFRSAD